MKDYDVVTVGSATLDVFIRSDKFNVVKSDDVRGGVAICQVYGGKMEVEDVTLTCGGGGTNTAVSFAKKDLNTACIAEMGNDPAALIVHRELEENQVDTRYLVQEPDETTAVSTILISKDGGRSIIVYRGASAMLDNKDLPLGEFKTRWIHVSSLGGNLGLLEKILSWAKKNNVRVSLNPGSKEIEERDKLIKLLPMVEILFMNREEAKKLYGKDYIEKGYPKESYVSVITDGVRGGCMFMREGKRIKYDAIKPKKSVDTTGAGDAFASGMVSGVLYGLSYEKSIEWGLKNAVSVVEYVGAKPGLLTLAQIK